MRAPLLIKRRFPGSEKLHDKLTAAIQGRLTSGGGSAIGTKRRAYDFLTWPIPEVAEIKRRFLFTLDRGAAWDLTAWANVNRLGDRNTRHNHSPRNGAFDVGGEAHWSGIYYVSSGLGHAPTIFHAISGEIRVFPEPGLFVIFPSDLDHSVDPHDGLADRVTIAVNAYRIPPDLSPEFPPKNRGDRDLVSEVR